MELHHIVIMRETWQLVIHIFSTTVKDLHTAALLIHCNIWNEFLCSQGKALTDFFKGFMLYIMLTCYKLAPQYIQDQYTPLDFQYDENLWLLVWRKYLLENLERKSLILQRTPLSHPLKTFPNDIWQEINILKGLP